MIQVAVQLAPQHATFERIRTAARAAEDLGADALFTWDHFAPLGKDRDGPHFECWTTLAAWAESTSRAAIGPLVSCVGYRNPDLLADMARTVDHVSGGRLILGLGAGFREWEFDAYGYDFGTPAARVAGVAAAVHRIRTRWAALRPPPVRRIPLLMAGDGPRMLRLVAEHADIWHTFADGEVLTAKSRRLDELCRELGRSPVDVGRSTFVRGDPAEEGPRYLAAGLTLFTVFTSGPDYDLTEARRWLTWRDAVNAG